MEGNAGSPRQPPHLPQDARPCLRKPRDERDPRRAPGEKRRPSVVHFYREAIPACERVIEVDVARILSYAKKFTNKDIRKSLSHLLRADSNADREGGYSLLLSYMDETRAFWAFWNLMQGNKHQHCRLYVAEFLRLGQLNRVWEEVLRRKYPKIGSHLKKVAVDPMAYTPAWFLTEFQAVFRVGDCENRGELLETADDEKCMFFLQKLMKSPKFDDWRDLIENLTNTF
jgi:hypothetical protein